MPAPPAALMVPPLRPAPPEGGTVRQLLHHAATFGGYVQELENQNAAWREWVRAGMDAGLRRHDDITFFAVIPDSIRDPGVFQYQRFSPV